MFNEKESKAFRKLKKIFPNLELRESSIGREISCHGYCKRDGKYLSITSESSPEQFEETLEVGVKIFDHLDEYIEKAKEAICKDFLPVYREDDDPDMTEKAFKDNLSLVSVGAFMGNVMTLDFNDKGMLGGHTLGANSLDKGETFTETEM